MNAAGCPKPYLNPKGSPFAWLAEARRSFQTALRATNVAGVRDFFFFNPPCTLKVGEAVSENLLRSY